MGRALQVRCNRRAVVVSLVLAAFAALPARAAGHRTVVLQVDRADLEQQDVRALRDEVAAILREKAPAVGVTLEPVPRGVRALVPDAAQRRTVREALRHLSRPLDMHRESLEVSEDAAGVRIALTSAGLGAHVRAVANQTLEILRRRLDAAGVAAIRTQRIGDDRIYVDVPETTTSVAITTLLSKQAKLEFRPVLDAAEPLGDGEILAADPANENKAAMRVERRAIVTGQDLTDVRPGVDSTTNEFVVDITMTKQAATRFGRFTTQNIGRMLALVLDSRWISAPIIRAPITGGALQISGHFTTASAYELALLLRTGALPAKLDIVTDDSFGGAGGTVEDALRGLSPPKRGK